VRSLVFFLSVLIALGASFVLVGFCAPIEQTTELSKEFSCSKNELWAKITSVEFFPDIKEDVFKVELVTGNCLKWREFSKLGAVTELEVIEQIEGEKLVVKITNAQNNIEKKRVYSLFENNEGSVLSIKEFTRVEKLLLRSTLAISGNKQEIKKELNSFAQHVSL